MHGEAEVDLLSFNYTSQIWEVVAMILLIVPGVFVLRLIALFCASLWVLLPLLVVVLLGPYVLMRLRPARLALKGSAAISREGVVFHLQFREIAFSWDKIDAIRYLSLEQRDTGRRRGLILSTKDWKEVNIYPVDQTLDQTYFAILKHYQHTR